MITAPHNGVFLRYTYPRDHGKAVPKMIQIPVSPCFFRLLHIDVMRHARDGKGRHLYKAKCYCSYYVYRDEDS
jgi:hypothetical protein